jgi:hypothetical protein
VIYATVSIGRRSRTITTITQFSISPKLLVSDFLPSLFSKLLPIKLTELHQFLCQAKIFCDKNPKNFIEFFDGR